MHPLLLVKFHDNCRQITEDGTWIAGTRTAVCCEHCLLLLPDPPRAVPRVTRSQTSLALVPGTAQFLFQQNKQEISERRTARSSKQVASSGLAVDNPYGATCILGGYLISLEQATTPPQQYVCEFR
jgi:hypothetical protein